MKHETNILREANRMVPLIRSITRETRDRTRAIRRLETRLETLSTSPGEHIAEMRRVESELFQHRRGIEQVENELARLGCSMDADHPERIVCSVANSEVSFEEHLDETGYRPDRSSPQT